MDNDAPASENSPAQTGRHAEHSGRGPAPKAKNNKKQMKHIILSLSIAALLTIFSYGGWSLYRSSTNAHIDSTQQSPDVQLVKLGSEIHGPDDAMIINKDQLLFFENLKKDGKVTDSINKYKSENN